MIRCPSFLSDLAASVKDYDALIAEAERASIYIQAKLQRHEKQASHQRVQEEPAIGLLRSKLSR